MPIVPKITMDAISERRALPEEDMFIPFTPLYNVMGGIITRRRVKGNARTQIDFPTEQVYNGNIPCERRLFHAE